MTKWTPERISKLRDLSKTLMNGELADYFNVSINSVSSAKIRYGIPKRQKDSEKLQDANDSISY